MVIGIDWRSSRTDGGSILRLIINFQPFAITMHIIPYIPCRFNNSSDHLGPLDQLSPY